ncbi:MAG: hypoxanthine phosphoribosyltransferase [Endomicrobiales bacterium]|nr:hypoxanthine phosphoribosyltransferase [Endomicrobiales bacterium]
MNINRKRKKDEIKKVLLTREQIQEKVKELAEKISSDYKNKELTIIGVLKGSIIFFSDLARCLKVDCSFDFISVSSYKKTKSTGVVRLLSDLREDPVGKNLLLVDEIVDTGYTLNYLHKNLKTRQPASVRTCVLLDKSGLRKVPVKIDYKGFVVPNSFLVGYGLDYKEKYRNLPYIGILKC